MTCQRFSFRIHPWMAAVCLTAATLLSAAGCRAPAGPGETSGGLAALMPGHENEELRKRVAADKFPSANQAVNTPVGDNGNRTLSGN